MDEAFKALTLADLQVSFDSLSDEEKDKLKSDAKTLRGTFLWKWLNEEMVRVAGKKLYHECTTMEELHFAKACFYMEDVRQRKINKLANMK